MIGRRQRRSVEDECDAEAYPKAAITLSLNLERECCCTFSYSSEKARIPLQEVSRSTWFGK